MASNHSGRCDTKLEDLIRKKLKHSRISKKNYYY